MTKVSEWHRAAELFIRREIQMWELVRFWILAEAFGMIIDDVPNVGMGIIDHTELNNALVLGIILALPADRPVSYPQIADLIRVHPNTVSNSVKRMISEEKIEKVEQGRAGTFYRVIKADHLPKWVREFTKALIELEIDPQLKAQVIAETEKIGFKRGLQVLRLELQEKFGRRS